MGKNDLFKRTLEAGTSFLDMSRERAEAVVKEWVDAGDLGKGRAQKAIDDVLERSRRATDDLRDLVRRETAAQLSSMGVATRDDIARLEAKLVAVAVAAATRPEPKRAAPRPAPRRAAAAPKTAVVKKAPAAPKTAAATRKAAAAAARAAAAQPAAENPAPGASAAGGATSPPGSGT